MFVRHISKFLKIHKIPLFIFLFITIIYIVPIFIHVNTIGILDWDLWLFYNEAARESILEFYQAPLWNPYYCGGNILLAHPESQVFSPTFLFILIFGSVLGMKIAIFLHFFFGLFAMYLLARHLKCTHLASYAGAFVYMLSAIFFLRMGIGQFSYLAMSYYPLAFLFFLKGLKSWRYGVVSSFFLALAFFSGAVYELAFFMLFLLVYALGVAFVERKFSHIFLIFIIFSFAFFFASVKLIPLLDFLQENSRMARFSVDESTSYQDFYDNIFKSTFLSKYYHGQPATPDDPRWWEGVMGVGWIGVFLVVIGYLACFRREKVLFLTSIFFIVTSLGGNFPINFWKLLHFLPPFESFYVIGRMNILLLFSFAIFTSIGFTTLQLKFEKYFQKSFFALVLLIILFSSLFSMNSNILNDALAVEIPSLVKNEVFKQTINGSRYLGFSSSNHYLAIQENKGDLTCFEEIRPANSVSALPQESPQYKGEAYLEKPGFAKIISFSPNKIIVEVDTFMDNLLILNQNYEKGWKVVSGEVEFYNGLLATKISPENKIVIFYYFPLIYLLGVLLTLSGIVFSYFFWKRYSKRKIFMGMFLLIALVFFIFISSFPIPAPEIYYSIQADPNPYSIVELPLTSPLFHAFRYYQEIHGKNVIWHHPSQKISYPAYLVKKIFSSEDLIDEQSVADVIVQDPQEIAISVLKYLGVNRILLHKKWYGSEVDWAILSLPASPYNYSKYRDWYGNIYYNETKEFLDSRFSLVSEDENIIVYNIPSIQELSSFIIMDKGWSWIEYDNGKKFTWMGEKSTLKIIAFKPEDRRLQINIKDTFNGPKTIEVFHDNAIVFDNIVEKQHISIRLILHKGENIIELKSNDCEKPSSISDNSRDKRCLSIAIGDISLT